MSPADRPSTMYEYTIGTVEEIQSSAMSSSSSLFEHIVILVDNPIHKQSITNANVENIANRLF